MQISFASGSTALSDRNRFKRYFRNSLTFELLAPALHSMLDHFQWRRIAVLTQDENLFTGVGIFKGVTSRGDGGDWREELSIHKLS